MKRLSCALLQTALLCVVVLCCDAFNTFTALRGIAKSKAIVLTSTYVLRYTKHQFFAPSGEDDDLVNPFLSYLQAMAPGKVVKKPTRLAAAPTPIAKTATLTIPAASLSITPSRSAKRGSLAMSTYLTKEELKLKFGIPIAETALGQSMKQSITRRKLSLANLGSGLANVWRKVLRKVGFYSLTTKSASKRIIEPTANIAEVDGRFLMQKRLLPSIQETEKLYKTVSRYPVPLTVGETLMKIKYELLTQLSGTDRGFTATRDQRMTIGTIIEFLHDYIAEHVGWNADLSHLLGSSVIRNATLHFPKSLDNWEDIASPRRSFQPTASAPPSNNDEFVPLEGVWKMVYTSAYDVLPLAANPFFTPQDVYTVLHRNGTAFNVIDLIPRVQTMLPPKKHLNTPSLLDAFEGNALRFIVTLAARAASEDRVQVGFRAVEAKIKQDLLPAAITSRLPHIPLPPLKVGIPRFPKRSLNEFSLTALFEDVKTIFNPALSKETPGHFDVVYLDKDMLITQQCKGGYFVFTREDKSIEDFFKSSGPY